MRVLREAAHGEGYVEDLLEAALVRAPLPHRDRALAQELVYGTVRWQATLDWLIQRKTDGRNQPLPLQILLRLGLYQLFWLDRIPDHAAVHETVQATREIGFGRRAGFVNALLRAYLREREPTQTLLADLRRQDPALGLSHPGWLVQRWQNRWGPESTLALLEWNNSPAPVFARVNTLKTDPSRLLERWRLENVEYGFGTWDWIPPNTVFRLNAHPPFPKLPSFNEGWFYLQDPSTLLAVTLLAPQPGHAVLDLCAAPGGKTSYIAQQLVPAPAPETLAAPPTPQSRLVAQDSSPERLELLRTNLQRLGAASVTTILAPTPTPLLPQRYDRVLVDAPCSNTGVLRRRVGLRWRILPSELKRLADTQYALLETAAQNVKPTGRIVYSTCSLEPEENQELVRRWLQSHPERHLATERELLPFHDHTDGAYVAALDPADGIKP